ncbi:MAG TPA: branched-chain amino acid ABC transporter permease [Solirubrobacteraceae bacterium]|nr:branched-chain amino acid ABC transporter permease [Solirubrobacteraceae bacterium]
MKSVARSGLARSTLVRSLILVAIVGLILLAVSAFIGDYRNTQLATGAYFFAALAGLTVLAGLSGKISLGHGALMAVGAYAVALLVGNEHWPLAAALAAGTVAAMIIGIPIGAAATRLHGPYLAGLTLAFAVGLPALADTYPSTFGGENGLTINPPTAPSWLGANFSFEHWEAWVACLGALIVLFVLYNLIHSGIGRSMRAARDDEIAAALCGLRVGPTHTLAFVVSAGCAGLGGGLLAVVNELAQPGAFPLALSLSLLTGVVLGGLGSLAGAVWGAALLVFLPSWTTDLGHAFSLSNQVAFNLPLAIYGIVLIVAMLAWPSGIQGGVRAIAGLVRSRFAARSQPAEVAPESQG